MKKNISPIISISNSRVRSPHIDYLPDIVREYMEMARWRAEKVRPGKTFKSCRAGPFPPFVSYPKVRYATNYGNPYLNSFSSKNPLCHH